MDETEETKPPGTTLYTIVGWCKQTLWDEWWLEAHTSDGTIIALANLAPDTYEVVVDDPHRGRRSYRGGPGSLAHDRYERFLRAYETLDEPPLESDTDQRQDD